MTARCKISNSIKCLIENWDDNIENDQDNARNLEIKSRVVYANNVLGWWLKSISSYFKLDIGRVQEIIIEFKMATSGWNRSRIIHRYKLKRKVTHQHIDSIEEFLIEHKGECFTVKTIQLFLNREFPELSKISDWSICKILNEKLN